MSFRIENINKKAKEIIVLRKKLFILDFIPKSKNSVRRECDEYGITRTSYYNWKKKLPTEGKDGLKRKNAL
jgi:hypothetical protein